MPRPWTPRGTAPYDVRVTTTAFALALLGATVLSVLVRPWRLSPAVFAAAAAALAVAAGLVRPADLAAVVHLTWDATLALVALMVISRLLDRAGLFRWAAWRTAAALGYRPRAIFLAAIVLSAAVSALFTNDGTVLILTPVLAELCRALRLDPAVAAPILLANGFVADAFSTPLVSSNLVNILAVDAYRLTFAGYAGAMALPALAALAVAAAVLWLAYGRRIPAAPAAPGSGPDPLADPLLVRLGLGVLALAGAAVVVTATRPFPLTWVLGPAAVLLWSVAAARYGVTAAWRLAREAPWEVVVFAAAMNVVILGVGQAGVLPAVVAWLRPRAAGGWAGPLTVGALAAVAAACVNNIPATLFALLALRPLAGPTPHGLALVLAAVAGNDIGPKLTPVGSLATLLWLRALADRGYDFGWRRYLRAGLLLTPPTLAAFLGALAWWG
jgi:arsenical pump membrane protein